MYRIFRSTADHMMAISPDEGATGRAIYLANVLGLDMGMFYKRRDYTTIVDGRNPIVAHEFLGSSVEGKDVIILDDMISSGDSILDVARQLKMRKAKRIFCCCYLRSFHKRYGKIRSGLRRRTDQRNPHNKPDLSDTGTAQPYLTTSTAT